MTQSSTRRQAVAILLVVALAATGLLVFAFLRARPQDDSPRGLQRPFDSWLSPTAEAASPFSLSPIVLADQLYRHPSGAFSVRYPENWQIDESEDAALFTAPDDSASFSVNFVVADSAGGDGLAARAESDLRVAWGDLPGFALRPASVALSNYWSAGFNYDQPPAPDHPARPMRGLAIVQLRDGVIFTQTFAASADLVNNVASAFQAIYESLVIDSHAANSNSE